VLLKKEVVVKTNKSDRNYISMTNKRLVELTNLMNEDNRLYVNLTEYETIEDKRNQNIKRVLFNIEVKELVKMGVRTYNKKDPSKNVYRVKYIKRENI